MTLIQLTTTGLVIPTPDEILTDLLDRIEEKFSPIYGEPLRRDPQSVFGMLAGVIAGAAVSEDDPFGGHGIYEIVQAIQEVHSAFDPRNATGAALEAISAITDTSKKLATASYGTYFATGDNTTALLAGDIVSNQAGDLRYALTVDLTLATATARATSTAITAGAVRSNSGGCYYAVVGGTTGTGPGPSGTTPGAPEIDGSVTWAYLGLGLAYASGTVQATTSGPVGGPAFSLSKIGTPRVGWRGGANPLAVTTGSGVEADEVLRVRRLAELHGNARAAIDAIRAAFLKRSDVSECIVFQNVEDVVSVDGLPPHSVEAIIDGAITDAAAGQLLLDTVAAGIKTYGTTTVLVADERGTIHTIKFTRPTLVSIYCKVTVTADRLLWQSQVDAAASPMTVGEVAARAAVLAYEPLLKLGVNVRHSRVGAAVINSGIAGVLGASVQLDTVAITTQPPADVAISLRQKADLVLGQTTVAVVYEDP